MTRTPNIDAEAFKAFEHQGWVEVASHYHDAFASLTRQTVEPLLDRAGVHSGSYVLDVASGTGHVAAAAATRGARVLGIDFSATMVAAARTLHPDLEFREGDAETLPIEDRSVDAVTMNFGLLHLARPEQAIAEAFRVLKPGGRFAFTVWAMPEHALAFQIVLGAIERHGKPDVPIPPGPPFFRFSDSDESKRALASAGFRGAAVELVPMRWRLNNPDAVFDAFWEGGVRTRAVLRAQETQALVSIRNAIRTAVERHPVDHGYELPMASVLASAERPL
jgi:SAM-dependent methyltransferase